MCKFVDSTPLSKFILHLIGEDAPNAFAHLHIF